MTLPEELIFHRKWWWDPIDMEIFKKLETNIQQQLIAVSLDSQAQMLKTQAAGLEKLGTFSRAAGNFYEKEEVTERPVLVSRF